MKRRILWIAAALAFLAVLIMLFRPSPQAVETAVVTRGSLAVTVSEEGRTRVRDRFVVSAPVAGRVSRFTLRDGDAVTRGALLARIAPVPLDSRVLEETRARFDAASDVARAANVAAARVRAGLEQATRERERIERLAGQGVTAPEQLERARLAEASAGRELEAQEYTASAAAHDVTVASAALLAADGGRISKASLPLVAPVSGKVLRVVEASERVVLAGTPLVEIGDPSRIEVVAELLSSEAVRIVAGAPVRVGQWGGGPPLSGCVRLIEPSGFTKVSALGVEEQRVRVIIDLDTLPPALADGYRVEVEILVSKSDHAIKAPVSALFRRGNDWSVFVVSGGRALARKVTAGRRNDSEAEVDGLTEGEIVIVHPSDQIVNGARVAERK